jgi:hypothetical protein
MMSDTTNIKRRWASPRQITQEYPIGLTHLYKLLGAGVVRSKMVDNRRWIDVESFDQHIASQPDDLGPGVPQSKQQLTA